MNETEYHDLKRLAERALHVVSCTEQSFENEDAERYRVGIRRAAIFILSGVDDHDLKRLAERALHFVSCTEQSFENEDAERYRVGIRRAAIFILSGVDETGGWLRRPQG